MTRLDVSTLLLMVQFETGVPRAQLAAAARDAGLDPEDATLAILRAIVVTIDPNGGYEFLDVNCPWWRAVRLADESKVNYG